MKIMKVLHIITGLGDGGAEAVLYRLCVNDSVYTHCVVSLMGDGKYGKLLRERSIKVRCLGLSRGRITFGSIYRLFQLLRIERPDIVQTWMYHADLVGGLVSRLAGVSRVFWGVRNTCLDPAGSKKATIYIAKLCSYLSNSVPLRIICCAQKALVVHRDIGYAAEKLCVIANGYDTYKIRRKQAARDRLKLEWMCGSVHMLGMVARFDPLKDHRNLFASLVLLKNRGLDFRCVLVGNGMDSANRILCEWLTEFGLKDEVLLLGARNDIPEIMSALDLHILSSWSEAFPNVLAEAMACETPCVTTDVGDAATIVGDTGWVVPPANPVKLAMAIQTAINEPLAIIRERGRAARERIASQFSLQCMVRSYHEVWMSSETGGIVCVE